MSVRRIYPELDDQLAAIGDPEAAEASGMFVVDTLDKANWAVRKVALHTARLAEAEAFAQRERDRLDLYLAGEREKAEQSCSFLAGLLRRFHEDRLTADPRAKTIHLPAGDLVARKGPDTVNVDVDVFLETQPDGSPLVRVKRQPDLPAVMRHVKQTGEVPAGVELVRGQVAYKVKPHIEVEP